MNKSWNQKFHFHSYLKRLLALLSPFTDLNDRFPYPFTRSPPRLRHDREYPVPSPPPQHTHRHRLLVYICCTVQAPSTCLEQFPFLRSFNAKNETKRYTRERLNCWFRKTRKETSSQHLTFLWIVGKFVLKENEKLHLCRGKLSLGKAIHSTKNNIPKRFCIWRFTSLIICLSSKQEMLSSVQ